MIPLALTLSVEGLFEGLAEGAVELVCGVDGERFAGVVEPWVVEE